MSKVLITKEVQPLAINEYKFGISDLLVPIRADGMINATALCKAGEKLLDHYKESTGYPLFFNAVIC